MKKLWSDFTKKGDMLLLTLCLLASGMGLALIYSATRYMGTNRYVLIQGFGVCVGVVLYFIETMVDLELLTEKMWKYMLAFNVVIVLALIPFGVGENTTGNKNWIPIPGLPINIQPAEVAKLFYILLMAYQIAKLREKDLLPHPTGILTLGGHALFMAGLIVVISGDYGMFLVYVLIMVTMAWCAGVKWGWFALGLGGVLGAVALLWNKLPAHIRKRILVIFLRNDPLDAGWQQEKSVLAIGSGGVTGQGFLQGYQTQRGGIIAQHTDEIFAVCGEEFGLVGCVVVLILLGAIIARCFYIGRKASSTMMSMTAYGVGGMLMAQSLINIAMCLYVFPVVGLPLPFFSYGGTSIITLYIAVGFVSSVKARDLPSWLQDRGQGLNGRI